jgi:hypothetical protein
MATTYLTRTPSSAGSNTVWTVSMWVKRASLASGKLNAAGTSSTYEFLFNGSGGLTLYNGAAEVFTTTRLFRDTSAWYHIVLAYNTTASGTDKCKLYINGTLESSFSTDNRSSAGAMSNINQAVVQYIGKTHAGGFFDGLMSHFNSIDGTQYAASEFGETDSTTGEWKIKTSPSVTYGTNGFFILKDGNSVTDQSGNSNNFTVGGGTLTNTEDCPSNVFATFAKNYLARNTSNPTFSNGGTTIGSGGDSGSFAGAIAPTTGKYYWEVKIVNANNSRRIGIIRSDATNTNSSTGFQIGGASGSTTIWTASYDGVNGYIIYRDGVTRTQLGTTYATYTTNDIIGVAVDCDNYTITWYKNNTLIYALSLNATYFEGGVFPANRHDTNQTLSYNFGNGVFGTTAVASAGTNASGIGIFEYDVPTGYTALSTKGLNL